MGRPSSWPHRAATATSSGSCTGNRTPLVRHAILRERFADVLTDTLRSLVLQLLGYRVEVVEFIDSAHPRATR